MNKYIKKNVSKKYDIDFNNCTSTDLEKVVEIDVHDCSDEYFGYMSAGIPYPQELQVWDFSDFPNLKILDCSYNSIKNLCVSNNKNLESLRWEGVRGDLGTLDLTKNTKLKKIIGGQDGLKELDLVTNINLEEVYIHLSQNLRWVNLDNCVNLKKICLVGCLIPFVDLTHCPSLEHVDINYLNSFSRNRNEFGPGYPRPFVFVDQDFDENVIDEERREKSYYYYHLVRVSPNSLEQQVLEKWKRRKSYFVSIPPIPSEIARVHYSLLKELETEVPLVQISSPTDQYKVKLLDPDELPF